MGTTFERLASALRGRYTLQREIGAGGMATVYLADDLRHGRKVAIKLLRPELSAIVGAERFLSEIRTTAALQHPHILPLFDSGSVPGGVLYYVMPHVSGESLRDRLQREKQLGVEEAVSITRAVATALDYAHRHGVIHRDVKPANILLHDGQPLVADFGIALAVSTAGGDRLTETGVGVGTPQYMSPEQAGGDRAVDGRSDQFSLACVAYEMLAGEPPFSAPTTSAVLSRILSQNPVSLVEHRPAVPAHVSAAVARALEKMPADRFESAAAFAKALGDVGFRWPPAPLTPPRRQARPPVVLAAVGLTALTTALGTWIVMRTNDAPNDAGSRDVRLTYVLPDDQFLPVGSSPAVLEISPQGTHLVYVGQQGRETQLYLRALDAFEARAIPGTRGALQAFFSPDGKWVGFYADRKLKKVALDGGIPIEIAALGDRPLGASWGADDSILYSLGASSLWRVSANGGAPRELPVVLARESPGPAIRGRPQTITALRWPRLLPDGRHALANFGYTDTQNQAGVTGVIDLATGEFRGLLGGNRPHFVRTGHIVFDAGRERLGVVPFDLERLRVTGPVVPLVDNALRSPGQGANFSVSSAGTLAYATGGFDRQLVIVDRYGRETPVRIPARGYRFPSVSPDGQYVAITVDPQPPNVWVVDLRRETTTPLTADSGYNFFAHWSPEGRRLVFNRWGVDTPGIYEARWPEVSGFRLVSPRTRHEAPRWAASDLLFVTPPGRRDLHLVDLRTGTDTKLLATEADERHASASPDGAWVAFTSNATGLEEVYVLPRIGRSAPIPVSSGGGTEPRWSRDGTELFYRNGSTITAVRVRTRPSFEILGRAAPLFSGPFDFSNEPNWDVLPGGRFLMVKNNPRVGREIRMMLNWSVATDSSARR